MQIKTKYLSSYMELLSDFLALNLTFKTRHEYISIGIGQPYFQQPIYNRLFIILFEQTLNVCHLLFSGYDWLTACSTFPDWTNGLGFPTLPSTTPCTASRKNKEDANYHISFEKAHGKVNQTLYFVNLGNYFTFDNEIRLNIISRKTGKLIFKYL